MKRLILVLIVVALLLLGIYSASNYDAVLARFNLEPTAQANTTLWGSGLIEADETSVVAEIGGQVTGVLADEGGEVEAGEVLVLLDTSVMNEQIGEAQAAVRSAQANLEATLRPVREEEIAIARARLEKAKTTRDGAARALQHAIEMRDNPLELNAEINGARAQVEVAEKQIEAAQAQLVQAEAGRDRYQFAASDQDKTTYQVYLKQVDAAHAAIAGATTARDGVQRQLEDLLKIRENPISLNVNVNAARSRLSLAEQAVAVAEADLALTEAGPRAEDVAIAQTQVELAKANLEELAVRRAKMTLFSPATGLIADRSIEVGEVAIPGRSLLAVSCLEKVTLTVYVPEDEIGRVRLGQAVDVYVDAFSKQAFSGVVSFIASEAEFTPKNVQTEKERVNMVFAVKVELPNPEYLLKPGMPADAHIRLDQDAEPSVLEALKDVSARATYVSPTPQPTQTPTPASIKRSAASITVTAQPETISTPQPTLSEPETTVGLAQPSPTPVVTTEATPTPEGKIILGIQTDTGRYELWQVTLDGNERHLIGAALHQPDVRGDGSIIAKGEGAGMPESLVVLRPDGSEVVGASQFNNDASPRWAPDGTRLLYTNRQDGTLVVQDDQRPDARRVPVYFDITPLLGRHPVWLDNDHIVYQGCDVWRGGSLCGLYVASVAGDTPPRRIVDDVHATGPAAHSGRVAYMSNASGSWDIYLLDAGAKSPVALTGGPAQDGIPTWSPTGEWLAFVSNQGGGWAVWAIRPQPGEEPFKLFDLDVALVPEWADEQMVWIP